MLLQNDTGVVELKLSENRNLETRYVIVDTLSTNT